MRKRLLTVIILLLVTCFSALASGIDLKLKNVTVEEALAAVHEIGNYSIILNSDKVDLAKIVSVDAKNARIEEVLDQILDGQALTYSIIGNKITITTHREKPTSQTVLQRIVSGIVTDATGAPAIGVSIMVKGSLSRGTVVNVNGAYSIAAEKGEILVVSGLGYQSKEIIVADSNRIDVVLEEDRTLLEEVVIVGYSPIRKSDFTGSLASVKSAELQKTTATVGQSLVGRVAGVEVMQTSGAPGQGVTLRVRGVNSLSASSTPLYVVDGYPASEDVYINPNDIESIDILKDAASAAIYGSRGASGVVLITTRRGKTNDTRVTYDFSYGWSSLEHKLDLLNAREFAELYVDARNNSYRAYCSKAGVEYNPADDNATRLNKVKNAGAAQTAILLSPYIWDFSKNTYADTAFQYDTDWQDVVFSHNAGMMRHNLSVTGGTQDLKYMASVGYLNQNGIMAPSKQEQVNARLNLDGQVTKKISISFNYSMYVAKTREVSSNGKSVEDGAIQCLLGYAPNFPAYYEDGTIAAGYMMYVSKWNGVSDFTPWIYDTTGTVYGFSAVENPLTILNNIEINRRRQRHNVSASVNWEIIEGLNLKAMVGGQWFSGTYKKYRDTTTGVNHMMAGDPRLESSYHYAISDFSTNEDLLTEITANYKKGFGNHHIDFLSGFSAQKKTYDAFGIKAIGFPDERIHDISYTTNKKAVSLNNVDRNAWTMSSWFSRLNYSFADLYTITGTFRTDGCSRFGANSKWGLFPSISAGWTFTNEPWMVDLKKVVEGRLRASYGLTGNNEIGNYSAYSSISSGTNSIGGVLVDTHYESAFVDADLTWERTRQLNVGLDLSFFDGRLNFIGNIYHSISTDVLYSKPIPVTSGYSTCMTNLTDSKIRNQGFDLQLDTRILQGAFNWNVGMNVSVNRNKVLSLGGVDDILSQSEMSTQSHITKVGYPVGSFLAFRTCGIMSEAIYKDVLKDREVYLSNGNKFPEGYTLLGPAVPSYNLELLSPGNVIYNDLNGDKNITNEDREILGCAYPKFTGGFTTSMDYKGFDLNLAVSFSYGAQVVNFTDYYIYNMEGSSNQYGIVRERYRSEDQPGNGFVPAAFRHGNRNTGMKMSDRYIDDASYIRIANVSLGYNFPNSFLQKTGIAGLRVYVSGDNLFTLTNYRGFNPEVSDKSSNLMPGFDWGCYPLARTISTGVKVTF